MSLTFACARCAHRFKVEESSDSRVCPECGFTRCFGVGVLSRSIDPPVAADRPDTKVQAEAGAEATHDNQSREHIVVRETNDDSHASAPFAATAVRPERKQRLGIVLIVLAVLAVALVCLVNRWMRIDRPTDEKSSLGDKAVPAETSEQLDPPTPVGDLEKPQPKVAGSLEEAKHAIVKFVMPLGIGSLTQYGTGFLVDSRGWIATNNHVIACITTEARVKLANGEELELEGIAARLPRHDLAIVKLKNPPSDLTLLDIGYDGRVPLGKEVYAFGHPYDAEFSLSKGIVSRVLTSEEWARGSERHLVARLRTPDGMIWIQHDAKISPGNSGGPLIDENGQVFGLNTFVHLKAGFGYASHVRYLRELTGSVSDQIEPLPDARKTVQTAVSSGRMLELFNAASQFEWHPRTSEQYDGLAELAKQMTLSKHALLAGGTSNLQSNVIHRVADVADQRFTALRELIWTDGRLNALNSFADGKLSNAGDGVLAYGEVLGTVRNQNMLLMRIDGTGSLIVLSGGSQLATMPRNSKWLVLGFVMPRLVKIQNATRSFHQQAPVVLTHYLLPVQQKN